MKCSNFVNNRIDIILQHPEIDLPDYRYSVGVGRTHAHTRSPTYTYTTGTKKLPDNSENFPSKSPTFLTVDARSDGQIVGLMRILIVNKHTHNTHAVRVVGYLQQGATNPRGWRLRTKAPHTQTQILCSALGYLSDALHTIIHFFLYILEVHNHHWRGGVLPIAYRTAAVYPYPYRCPKTTLTRTHNHTHALAIRPLNAESGSQSLDGPNKTDSGYPMDAQAHRYSPSDSDTPLR